MPKHHRAFTVSELIEELSKYPSDAKVQIEDADTNWRIPKFTIIYIAGNGVWILPCPYTDMEKE